MADLLDTIRAELRERLDASRAAVEEYNRLEAALRALGQTHAGGSGETAARSTRASRRRTRADQPASASADGGGEARARAPRGANRDAVMRVVQERSGVTAAELAQETGISRNTLNGLLRRLVERGELRKQDLPGGQAGYSIATGDADTAHSNESPDNASPATDAGADGETGTEAIPASDPEPQTAS